MKKNHKRLLLLFCSLFLFASYGLAQQTSPTPPDEIIKIDSEEVYLNVTAENIYGDSVPDLKADDLLIVESGDPQEVTSIKRKPASVLLLLDTGGNLNFVKTLDRTRLTAQLLVAKLSSEHSVSVIQSYNKIETVSDWTVDKDKTQNDLEKKLFAGNYSRFYDSINFAIEKFKTRSLENRHLVFIGDGLDTIVDEKIRQQVLQDLLAANITVHVIGYNKMETNDSKPFQRRIQFGEKNETRRIPEDVLEKIVEELPRKLRDNFRRFVISERLLVIRLDKKKKKLIKEKVENWEKSETELTNVSEDTGGVYQFPEELGTMLIVAKNIAKAINSQYIVTYTPIKPFAESEKGEERKIRVSTHLSGIRIRARQKIVVSKTGKSVN